jgi:hypothetical protein
VKSRRRDREKYEVAAKATRWAFRLYIDARDEARWTKADLDVFLAVVACTGTYSKVWEWITVRLIAELTGRHPRTCSKSLHKLDAHDVISFDGGIGREWSRVSLPTAGGRSAWAARGGDDMAASQSADDNSRETAVGREAPHPNRPPLDDREAATMQPPQTRRHRGRHFREGLSRSERPFEKEEQVAGLAPVAEEGEGTEQGSPRRGSVYFDVHTGEEIEPRSNEAWPWQERR